MCIDTRRCSDQRWRATTERDCIHCETTSVQLAQVMPRLWNTRTVADCASSSEGPRSHRQNCDTRHFPSHFHEVRLPQLPPTSQIRPQHLGQTRRVQFLEPVQAQACGTSAARTEAAPLPADTGHQRAADPQQGCIGAALHGRDPSRRSNSPLRRVSSSRSLFGPSSQREAGARQPSPSA